MGGDVACAPAATGARWTATVTAIQQGAMVPQTVVLLGDPYLGYAVSQHALHAIANTHVIVSTGQIGVTWPGAEQVYGPYAATEAAYFSLRPSDHGITLSLWEGTRQPATVHFVAAPDFDRLASTLRV